MELRGTEFGVKNGVWRIHQCVHENTQLNAIHWVDYILRPFFSSVRIVGRYSI